MKDPDVVELAYCHIAPALWGDYDAEVHVSSHKTVDRRPRLFRLEKGTLREEVAAAEPRGDLSTGRSGTVSMTSAEEAFKKGIPFYITNVTFEPPKTLSYTVLSNPSVFFSQVAGRLAPSRTATERWLREGGFGPSTTVASQRLLSSATQPQLRKWTELRGADADKVLSLVRPATWRYQYCLVSNEVPLGFLIKQAEPR